MTPRKRLPDLMTIQMVADELGIPERTARTLCGRVPRVYIDDVRRVFVRRVDLHRVLRDDPPPSMRRA